MIGAAMLYAVLVGAFVSCAASLVAHQLRSHGRTERWVWAVAMALAAVLPAWALLVRPIATLAPVVTPSGAGVGEIGLLGLPRAVSVSVSSPWPSFESAVVTAWLLVSGFLALRWGFAALRLARRRRLWRPSKVDGVTVWVTDDIGPGVFGLFDPRIAVPTWVADLPRHERSAILAHEAEHIAARDPWLVALSRAVAVAAPWNPIAWLLGGRLRRAVELDCDRRVLRARQDVAAYCRTLLHLSSREALSMVAPTAFADAEVSLRTRILALTTPPRSLRMRSALLTVVAACTLLAAACEVPVPAADAAVPAPVAVQQSEPARDSVEQMIEMHRQMSAAESRLNAMRVTLRSMSPGDPVYDVVVENIERQEQLITELRAWFGPDGGGAPSTARIFMLPGDSGFRRLTVWPSVTNPDEVAGAIGREYPQDLRAAGVGGSVTVALVVDEGGSVQSASVAQSSFIVALDEAAVAAARTMRFTPGEVDGVPVATTLYVPIIFNPDPNS